MVASPSEPMLPLPKVGKPTGDSVDVSIGPKFLELFSAQMYSSPNKAFEELVSNSWDAEARVVYVTVPEDLNSPTAAVWVLDDGESMDVEGFRQLWSIANSKKREGTAKNREPIGKFGIGKLSTYVLARQLTHVCRASDGKIRMISMDYEAIEQGSPTALHGPTVTLEIRELAEADLETLLTTFSGGSRMLDIITRGIPVPTADGESDEFGGRAVAEPKPTGTWTLAILTQLKDVGRGMQPVVIRRMLRFALPLKSTISIVFNEELLVSKKEDIAETMAWVLGKNELITELELRDDDVREVRSHKKPFPHVTIDGFPGAISGTITLFADRISTGKSAEEIGTSHGFHVNVKGRVINLRDPYFGLKNLSHSAWAKFRAAIRADGLDDSLRAHRETVKHDESLEIFKGFLLAVFNKVRTYHDALIRDSVLDVGRVLTAGWSAVPLEPLRRAVSDGLAAGEVSDLPLFVDSSELDMSAAAAKAEFDAETESSPQDVIRGVTVEVRDVDAPLVQYRLSRRDVVVNASHPFAREHGGTPEQLWLLRNAAVVDLLSDAYLVSELGVAETTVRELAEYRDQMHRLVALVSRRTGAQVAESLIAATGHAKGLERIVGDALEHLGLVVKRLGQSGEPEGIAAAPIPPQHDVKRSYAVAYDAKSSQSGKVAAKDMNVAGLVRHRKKHAADFTLVVAPEYAAGAVEEEAQEHSITPMRASDLAKLLLVTVGTGPLDLDNDFRALLQLRTPDDVSKWVSLYEQEASKRTRLSFDLFFAALKQIGFKGPNAIEASVVAAKIADLSQSSGFHPTRKEVADVARGLSTLMPNLITVVNWDIFLSTSPEKIRDELVAQLSKFEPQYRAAWSVETRTGKKK